jgi:hypothetical protein
MAFQALKGVSIIPKGANNRYVSQNWQTSQAFGGWIFKADCKIGFSDKPTEISMQIVLETNSDLSNLVPQVFDISPNDLQCGAGAGGTEQESLYDIDFNGVLLSDFVLFSYDMDIQPNQKTLSVVFKDYSIVLDKIYVGLIKRQGTEFIKSAQASGIIPVVCPDCEFGSWTGDGAVVRDIDYGSYVGIGGKTYDNLAGTPITNALSAWQYLYELPTQQPTFDLNGGYIILGMEQMYSDVCSTVPEMKYTFHQLLASLRVRGLNFDGAFTGFLLTGTPYMQNYVGTLREVLNNWCSDFGLQFYTTGRTFIGLNMVNQIDIERIMSIADPKTTLGAEFDGSSQVALSNYRESHTLENTFKQSVITADVRPRQINNESRDVKNFVSFQPLHPLDFYSPDFSPLFAEVLQNHLSTVRHRTTGVQFANDFMATKKRFSSFTNRYFKDIDISIALTKYDPDMRDIYCANRAIQANIDEGGVFDPNTTSNDNVSDFYANFAALGFIPQIQITNVTAKEAAIRKLLGGNLSQNISLNPDFYEVFVGYYQPYLKQEVTSFEGTWAGAMYKYGVLNIGTTDVPPFVHKDFNQWDTPTGGLYGVSGDYLTKLVNTFTPAANFYPIYQDAPYYDLMPYHILGFNPNAYTGASLGNIGFDSNQYYVGSLSNEWGTLDFQYKQELYDALSPVCEQMFSVSDNLQKIQRELPQSIQHFNIKDFMPTFHPNIGEVYNDLKAELDNLSTTATDAIGILAVGTDSRIHQECAKLHVCIVPNIETHPNARISFNMNDYYDSYNAIMARNLFLQYETQRLELLKQVPPNICKYSPVSVVCNTGLLLSGEAHSGDSKFSCTNIDDPISILWAGWPSGFASGNNARSLSITVERNPVTSMEQKGLDGEYYYDEALQAVPSLIHRIASTKIIYPISNKPNDLFEYIGLMSSTISRELRTPPFMEIYGSPVSETGNNTSMVKTINNTIDPDVKPILDPNTMRFKNYATVYSGNANGTVLQTIQDYHNFISELNSYQSNFPMKSATFNVVGSPNLFGDFINSVTPSSGLTSFTVSIGDNGVETSLSFSNKPPTLPKQEAILNSIGPRLKPL